jgi:hypothetical protein
VFVFILSILSACVRVRVETDYTIQFSKIYKLVVNLEKKDFKYKNEEWRTVWTDKTFAWDKDNLTEDEKLGAYMYKHWEGQ